MRTLRVILAILLAPLAAFATCTTGSSGACEVGPGKTYATIAACLSAAVAGQTCLVFASTYTENPSIPAGNVGSYITLQANGSDTITINGQVTLHSHTKLLGNCPALAGTVTSASCGFFIQNASSPTTQCITVASSSTDYFATFNNGYDCAGYGEGGTDTFGYVYGNTFSYLCSTSGSPNTCTAINIVGDHKVIENNDFSHFNNCMKANGLHIVIRANNCHDAHTNETGSNSGGDNHMDWIELSGNNSQFVLLEGNQAFNWFVDGAGGVGGSPAAHGGPLAQCGSGPCGNTILRFQVDYHVQGSSTTADQGNWPHLVEYNNDWIDMQNGTSGSAITNNQQNETSGANLNELYYYVTNPNGGWNAYYYDSPGGNNSNYGFNMAWCPNESSASCTSGVLNHANASFTSDTGNQVANPQFTNFSAQDFHPQQGSPALSAGTYLTTVANTDSGSGTSLIVNDASYFQDGWGLPSGAGLGQVTPDCISVTTVTNHVCITAINYGTNTITLASGISRAHGDHVWLYSDSKDVVRLTGSAPNIGAFGAEVTITPPPATPGVLMMGTVVKEEHEREIYNHPCAGILDCTLAFLSTDSTRY